MSLPLDQPDPGRPSATTSAEEAAAGALPELVSLMLSTSGVDDFLRELAAVAAASVDHASCGITLQRDGQPLTVASSDELASAVDEVQYGSGEGPCLESMGTGEVVDVPDMGAEQRWGGYVPHALGYGVASSLSLPLSAQGAPAGALNLYARTAHAFDDLGDRTRAASLAAQASAVLTVITRQAAQAQLTAQLRETLASRGVIDQAIGILMGQQRCSASAAFAVLRTASQHRNRKLRDIAADVITSATGAPPEPPSFTDPR